MLRTDRAGIAEFGKWIVLFSRDFRHARNDSAVHMIGLWSPTLRGEDRRRKQDGLSGHIVAG